ncbi:MAG TPA: hypothetical protein VK277_09840 [Acidimicrobiales bacterium]|nr:hypothetical protein [Acidimicrobiales bacterium]
MELAEAIAATVSAVPPEDQETAVAYIAEEPLERGDVVYVDRRPEVVEKRTYLGYVDCEAGKNWGHRCRYVRCGVDDSSVEVTLASFPPTLARGRRQFVPQAIGKRVPDWAVLGAPEV